MSKIDFLLQQPVEAVISSKYIFSQLDAELCTSQSIEIGLAKSHHLTRHLKSIKKSRKLISNGPFVKDNWLIRKGELEESANAKRELIGRTQIESS